MKKTGMSKKRRSDVRQCGREIRKAEKNEIRKGRKEKVDFYYTFIPHCHSGSGMRKLWPRLCLISLSYLAFPLVRLSISEAFGGSRLSLSFGENELSWKLHYLPCLM